MNFVSVEFAVLFSLVLSVYFFLSHRRQNRMLLVASYIFYGWWDWRFLSLILFSTIVDYFCALGADPQSEHPGSPGKRRLFVSLSICTNLGILGFFKYCNFFVNSFEDMLVRIGVTVDLPMIEILLPVGISFYTFQTMSYTIDVYRGQLRATRNWPDFMLYVSFFPQLVAGPIERGVHLLPQILKPRKITLDGFYSGAQLAFWGLFKKIVIADNLSIIVNDTFGNPEAAGGAYILAIYAFTFQIYCDFSGYTDIARGISRMLGFDICVNFRLPYFATNPSDFWARWHISLSSWLRDYLYLPLGGNRGGTLFTYRNLCITMLLGGLWHGASWHFVFWGAYHGALLVAFRVFSRRKQTKFVEGPTRSGLKFWIKVFLYFHLTCLGWLIFRVDTMEEAFSCVNLILTTTSWESFSTVSIVQLLILVTPLFAMQLIQYHVNDMEPWTRWPVYVRTGFYLFMIYGIIFYGAPVVEAFIYFQF